MTHNPPPLVSPVPGLTFAPCSTRMRWSPRAWHSRTTATVPYCWSARTSPRRAVDASSSPGRRRLRTSDGSRRPRASPASVTPPRADPTSPPTSHRRWPTGCVWPVRRRTVPSGSSLPRWPMYSPPPTRPASSMRRSAQQRFSSMVARHGWVDSGRGAGPRRTARSLGSTAPEHRGGGRRRRHRRYAGQRRL